MRKSKFQQRLEEMQERSKKEKTKDPFDVMVEDLYQESKSLRRRKSKFQQRMEYHIGQVAYRVFKKYLGNQFTIVPLKEEELVETDPKLVK